jgi:hypothetical protein
MSKDGARLVWEREGQWKIMEEKGPTLNMGGGVLHDGEGTYSAAACLLPHRHARLVNCSSLVFNFKKFVFPHVNYSSLDFNFK